MKYSLDNNTGCWNWNGCVGTHGYGVLTFKQKHYLAHRFYYEKHKGKIPKGKCLLHKCDNRRCVNPEHLRPGTRAENQLDMKQKGRSICIIPEETVNAIRIEYANNNITYTDLGIKYNVSRVHVKRLVMGKYR